MARAEVCEVRGETTPTMATNNGLKPRTLLSGGHRRADAQKPSAATHSIQDGGQSVSDAHQEDAPVRSIDAGDHAAPDAHVKSVSGPSINAGGQSGSDAHRAGAASPHTTSETTSPMTTMTSMSPAPSTIAEGQAGCDTHSTRSLRDSLADLTAIYRRRVDYHTAEKRLTLQIKAICRRICGGDKDEADRLYKAMTSDPAKHEFGAAALASCLPLIDARAGLESYRKQIEKELEKATKKLPIWTEWAAHVRGIGPLMLGQVVAEAGDISRFDTVSKLWKRMGLAVIGGRRQRRVSGDEALEHGYCPRRRSIVWNVGECMVKAGGEFREIYLQRLHVEADKAADEGLEVVSTTAATVKAWEAAGKPAIVHVKTADPEKHRTAAHMHARAKRYMEKEFLKTLWRAWREVMR